jgi:hypothetical protein
LSSENPQTKTPPALWWDHSNGANSNPPWLVGNCAIGGVFYTGTSYPASYQNRYYLADYGVGWIKSIQVDANDNVVSVTNFISNAGGIVDVEADPVSGDLFYIDINSNLIRRIRYVGGGNRNPIVNASVNPTSGYAPLAVTMTASGSTDPDGDVLSYLWDFGNGVTSTNANTSYTYTTLGTYNVTVTVSDGRGGSAIAGFQVVVGQIPPPGNILQPISNTFFNQNQSLSLQATSADPANGPATYQWDIDLHHNNHFHFSTETYFGQTASFIPSTPNDGEQYSFRIRLGVTQGALSSFDTADVFPRLNLLPATISSPSPNVNSAFQVTAKIRSIGEVGSSVSSYEIREGASVLASGTLNPIRNGDSLSIVSTIGPLSLGRHTIQFVVDPTNNLVETNESDNSISGVVDVGYLVAAYAFNEGSGTSVADASGHGLTGTISGATWTTAGKYSNALSFNGSTNYVDFGNPALLQMTGSMTLSAWARAAANPSDDGQIVSRSGDYSGWQLKTSPDTGPHTFAIAVSINGTVLATRYSNTTRALNTWYHVAGVYNASAQTLDIYVNGVLDNGVLTGTVPASQYTTALNVNVGRRPAGYYFNGIIDDVRIYNRALTQAEIQSDMNTPVGTSPSPPTAPVLATPTNGATGVATNPTLTWNASTGATSYRVQVSTDPAFGTTVVDQSNITTTSYAVSSLSTSTTYYWHVSATNSSGTSAYSTNSSFTTAAPPPPPPAPVLVTPANGATGVATNPTLTWNAATGATSYRIQISTDQAFGTTVADQSNIATTSYAASGLLANTTYYWHVNATNSTGTSAYSTNSSFTTATPPPPPTPPVLATPADGATGVATNPTLTWNASAGATSYRVQVSTDPAFGATVADQSNIATTSYATSGLLANTTYYWHVNATNSSGPSAYSTNSSFTTTAIPAGLVAAYAFDQGTGTTVADASGHGLTGTITGATWTTAGKYNGALSFNGTSNYVNLANPTSLRLTGSMTLSAWVKAAANPTGDAQVIAKSDATAGWQLKTRLVSGSHTFATAVSPTSTSRTQRNGTTVRSLNTWYHVASVYNATAQTLDIYVNGVLDNGTLTGAVPTSQFNSSVSVNIGRQQKGGGYFNGVIDEVRIYNRALTQTEIQSDMATPLGVPPAPPVAPVLATPANGATGVATNPTLTWNASTGATSYRVQLSTDPAFGTTLVDQSNIPTTSYAASGLSASTTYYWHVNAANGAGTSSYAATWSFATAAPPSPPAAPVLATPANGATGITTNPTLTWNASAGATSYRVQVSTDPAFGTTVADQIGIATTSYAVSSLASSTLYYWRVNAINGGGTSPYAAAWSFTTSAIPAGLVAAYAFDEGSGTTVADASGHGLTGTISGATWTTAGKYGNALSFNGTSSYVDLGNPALLQITGSMTWSAWVRAAANPPDDGQIIAKSDNNSGWQFKTSPDTGPHTFGVSVSASSTVHTQRYSTTVRSLNTWYHVAGVYNAAALTLDIYVNGVLDNGVLRDVVPSSQFNANVNANIGRRTGGYYFNGIIDEARVYNRALTQAEILSDMNTPLGTFTARPTIISFEAETTDGSIIVTSDDADGKLWVHPAADGLEDPGSGDVPSSRATTFKVSTTGGGTVSYQWQKNGMNMPGANSPSYTLILGSSAEVTSVRCVVSNSLGADTTDVATVSSHLTSNAVAKSVHSEQPLPVEYSLEQNYPNPFNPTTTIGYAVPRESEVRLQLFNVLGELVATLEDQLRPPGNFEVSFSSDGMASGVYIYRLHAGNFVASRKLLLLR